jgi:ubiquinone/menaquinone biosynthesis C-methylase UbiE
MRDHFNWIAPLYDRVMHFSDPSQLVALLQPGPDQRLLDVGGGTGRVTHIIADYVGQACVLDVSRGMLQEAQAKGLCVYRGKAENLPFPDVAFDRILIVDAFHHFQMWPQAVAELLRVLRPGGRLVIEEPDIRHPLVKLIALGERMLLMRSRFYAPVDLGALFRNAGGRVQLHDDQAGVFWAVIER